jgi:hypothetical protein
MGQPDHRGQKAGSALIAPVASLARMGLSGWGRTATKANLEAVHG